MPGLRAYNMETKSIRGVGRFRPDTMPHLAEIIIHAQKSSSGAQILNVDYVLEDSRPGANQRNTLALRIVC